MANNDNGDNGNPIDVIHETQQKLDGLIYDLGREVVQAYFDARLKESVREPSVALAESVLGEERFLIEALQSNSEVQVQLAKWLKVALDEHLAQWQRARRNDLVYLASETLDAVDLPSYRGSREWAFAREARHSNGPDWYKASEDQFAGLGRMLGAGQSKGEEVSAIIEEWFNSNYFIKFSKGWRP